MNRRGFLAGSGAGLALSIAGCLTGEPTEDDEHACTREAWNVVLYNESPSEKSMAVTITDSEDQVVFSETITVDAETDRTTGIELDTEVYYENAYTFEAALSKGGTVTEETVVDCGDVYIFVTESGEVDIRDDSHEGD